jgi:hypothetical protein
MKKSIQTNSVLDKPLGGRAAFFKWRGGWRKGADESAGLSFFGEV